MPIDLLNEESPYLKAFCFSSLVSSVKKNLPLKCLSGILSIYKNDSDQDGYISSTFNKRLHLLVVICTVFF